MACDDASLAKPAETGAPIVFEFDVAAGDYVVRLVARDSNDEQISDEGAPISVSK